MIENLGGENSPTTMTQVTVKILLYFHQLNLCNCGHSVCVVLYSSLKLY